MNDTISSTSGKSPGQTERWSPHQINVLRFLESHLGPIIYGWAEEFEKDGLPFSVWKFEGGPIPNTSTYVTAGLSEIDLRSSKSGKLIHHELLIMAPTSFGDRNIPALLHQIGSSVLRDKSPLLCGEVIGPQGSIFTGSKLSAFYATMPVYLPPEFENNDLVVFVWLVPITDEEARFIKEQGWDKFEDFLEEEDPNLLDFDRSSIV